MKLVKWQTIHRVINVQEIISLKLQKFEFQLISFNMVSFFFSFRRRNSFQKTCTDFNIFVCNEMKMAFKVMKRSKFRYVFHENSQSTCKFIWYLLVGFRNLKVFLFWIFHFHSPMEGFKPLLASVVRQFYYMGIGCGLLRVLLACDSRSNR